MDFFVKVKKDKPVSAMDVVKAVRQNQKKKKREEEIKRKKKRGNLK